MADHNPVPDLIDTRPPRRVMSAKVLNATDEVAVLRGVDGRTLMLPATEFPADVRFEQGQRLFTLLMQEGPSPVVSASHPQLVAALLEAAVPEIRDGSIRIMATARTAGRRAKIAVASTVDGLDPIPPCVGRSAARIKRVIRQLSGEKVDVVAWHEDRATFLANALNPAEVIDVTIAGEDAIATVPVQQVPAAVGKGGLNSALAGKLTDLQVSIAQA